MTFYADRWPNPHRFNAILNSTPQYAFIKCQIDDFSLLYRNIALTWENMVSNLICWKSSWIRLTTFYFFIKINSKGTNDNQDIFSHNIRSSPCVFVFLSLGPAFPPQSVQFGNIFRELTSGHLHTYASMLEC